MLVRTPKPRLYESLSGYVLRLADENGYTSPAPVLRLMGVRSFTPYCPRIDTRALEKIIGARTGALDRLSHRWPGDSEFGGTKADFRFLGHKLRYVLPYKPIRVNNYVVCPDCVAECGYMDAFWDLSLAVACPVHQKMLLSICPHCVRPIAWNRQGLLRCKCGGSLDVPCEVAKSEPLLRLMEVLRSAVHRVPRPGLDWDHWKLSRLISSLHHMSEYSHRYGDGGPTALQRIEAILGAWPDIESYLIELNADAYFDNPLTKPKKSLSLSQKELLADLYNRQMKFDFGSDDDPELLAQINRERRRY